MTLSTFDLSGKVAVVTGASRGLGQYFARALAKAGADLVITSRNPDHLLDFKKEIESMGRKALPVALDVTQYNSIQDMAKTVLDHYQSIHILVNNAGCNVRKASTEVTWDDWNLVLNTNLRGTFFVAQAMAQSMIQNKYGRIINIGSVTTAFGYAGLAPYCASRGGVKQLTMSLAADWGKHGITVNCLAPGWFKTAQTKVLYEDKGWVDYLVERIPPGPARGPGRPGGGRWCFWLPTPALMSAARPSWWTAASPPAPCGPCPPPTQNKDKDS